MNDLKLLSKRCHKAFPSLKNPVLIRVFSVFGIIPTGCRDLHLKQICLANMIPAILIILIVHIIIAIRWMLIKILSAVINGQRSHKVIVPGGCYLDVNIIRKIDRKIKISAESFR